MTMPRFFIPSELTMWVVFSRMIRRLGETFPRKIPSRPTRSWMCCRPSSSSSTSASSSGSPRKRPTLEQRRGERRKLDGLGVPAFREYLSSQGLKLERTTISTLQLNIGLYCNQACTHCHVESSPKRTEMMSQAVAERCLWLLERSPSITRLDLTGGAPELNKQFRFLVSGASKLREETGRALEVVDRCNLTVLEEDGQEDLADFLAHHKVHVIASLPCYEERNVDLQRGASVFARSIRGLRKLNERGYGVEGSGLSLSLVYNPLGAFLPPAQAALEHKYKAELKERFGIGFNQLLCITNMPVKRFADALYKAGKLQEYMKLLVRSFNSAALDGVMCRSYLNVGWMGDVYCCDFNQQLGMQLPKEGTSTADASARGLTVWDLQSAADLEPRPILTGRHCYGCTAGEGSSCQGALQVAAE